MARRMIETQFKKMMKDPSLYCNTGPVDDDIFHWEGFITGLGNTPYDGGLFKITIRFPPSYPLNPPKIDFNTKVYHPNINDTGSVKLDILRNYWCPGYEIQRVLLIVREMLANPNIDDPLVHRNK
ncbi:hypothetical protein N665_0031s0019 [Sinapis alba]|nr:hypothetical protein N665_0031s0019 [Sinapis alba]